MVTLDVSNSLIVVFAASPSAVVVAVALGSLGFEVGGAGHETNVRQERVELVSHLLDHVQRVL